ncbi:hypothetical protein P7K49_020360, partial [Saguinus oedipus]
IHLKQPTGKGDTEETKPRPPGLQLRGAEHAGRSLPPEEHKRPQKWKKLASGQPDVADLLAPRRE